MFILKLRFLGVIGILLFFTSCIEIIEPSISDRKVILLAPSDSIESNRYNQNFWWEPVEDALYYRLQIVAPAFDSAARLVIDTLIQESEFTFVLEPGEYEWRVRAENGSSETIYSNHFLSIIESSIKNQQVQLKLPENDFLTNIADITYKWEALSGSAQYRLQIDTGNFQSEDKLVLNQTTGQLELNVPFESENVYQWRVRAENDSIQSKWSSIYTISFDKTPPVQVILTSPADDQSVVKPAALKWESVTGATKYELFVYKSDSTTVYNTTFPLSLTSTSYNFNEGTLNEKIYWKVRAIDKAGNQGLFSELRNFFIQ